MVTGMYLGSEPYDRTSYIDHHHGDGSNMLRDEAYGQPRTLVTGDVLADGREIAEAWSDEGNGGVGLHFTDGTTRVVPARIPLLLAGGEHGKYPIDLKVGDIFETGCVVLASPSKLRADNPRHQNRRREVEVHITGGRDGHTVDVPEDLLIALHREIYPPSIVAKFGTFVVDRTMGMGASARANLPQYGRLDNQPEQERVAGVIDAISALREIARLHREDYEQILDSLKAQCEQLEGVILNMTGRLQARGNQVIHPEDPRSRIEDMLVEITSAQVNTYPGHGSRVTLYQPFIEIQGRDTATGEHVMAWMDAGEFGVTVEIPNIQDEH